MPWCSLPWKRNAFPGQACAASVRHHKKLSPYLHLYLFSFPLLPLLLPLLVYFSGFYDTIVIPPLIRKLYNHLFVSSPWNTTFYFPFSFFLWNQKNVSRQICRLSTNQNFLFFSIFITPHIVLTFYLPRNLLFVYPLTTEIPFFLT